MTVVVIFIMVAFIGGSALRQILMRTGGGNKVLWYYGEQEKITVRDRSNALSDLALLRMLGVDRLAFGMTDFKSRLLGQ